MPDKHEVDADADADAANSSSPIAIVIACKYKHEGKAKREDNMERVESFVVLGAGRSQDMDMVDNGMTMTQR